MGKSCILTRLTKDQFDTEHNVTVGVDFGSCLMKVEDLTLKLQIWDTAGQESFRSITKIFYRSADAVILSYSINQRDSFEHLSSWINEVHEQCPEEAMIFLVGNKLDLESEREVSREAARAFQRQHDIKYFTETSAKSGDNVTRLFHDASKLLYLHLKQMDEATSHDSQSSFSGDRTISQNSISGANNPRFGTEDLND